MGIWLKDRYVAPYGWLINKHIREYDLSKANISILLDTGFITKDQYTKYFNMPKQEREISVGILQRDNKEIAKGLSDGFKLIRERFFKENDLNEEEVLYIDKDSSSFRSFSLKNLSRISLNPSDNPLAISLLSL